MSRYTKAEIARTLWELLKSKPLDDITVTELVERCGISRQAFYYHFTDLYGVIDWSIQCELEKRGQVQPEQWREALETLFDALQRNRVVLLNVYHAYERSYVEYNLRRWIMPLVQVKVRETAQAHQVTQAQVEFVTGLCVQGLASILLSWFERGMPSSVTDNVGVSDSLEDFYCVMEGSLDYIMERLAQKNR